MRKESPLVFQKLRFNVYGQEAVHSRSKETLDTESLIGWYGYTSDERSANKKAELKKDKMGWLSYTSRNLGENTYSHLGWLTKDKIDSFKSQLAQAFKKDGDVFYDTVVSFRDFETAYRNGFKNAADYARVYKKIMPSFFRKIGLDPENMIWWIGYHDDTDNPHCHVTFMEKKRTRENIMLSRKELSMWKMSVQAELGLRNRFKEMEGMDSREYFKMKDKAKTEVVVGAANLIVDLRNANIEKLYRSLPRTGRMQYGSRNMLPYKKMIDHIIEEILKDEVVAQKYDAFMEKCERLDEIRNEANGTRLSNIKEAEKKKLFKEIGNLILSNYQKNSDINKEIPNQIKGKGLAIEAAANLVIAHEGDRTAVRIPKRKEYFWIDDERIHVSDDSAIFVLEDGERIEVFHDTDLFKPDHRLVQEEMDEYDRLEILKSFSRGYIVDKKCSEDVRKGTLDPKKTGKKVAYHTNFKKRTYSEAKAKTDLNKLISRQEYEIDRDISIYLKSGVTERE